MMPDLVLLTYRVICPLITPPTFYTSEEVIVLKGTLIVIVESPWHSFAYFHVEDTYICVISKIHKQIVDFTISADV